MSDRIPSLTGDKKDRSSLNIKALKPSKKNLYFLGAVLFGIAIVIMSIVKALNAVDSSSEKIIDADTSHLDGAYEETTDQLIDFMEPIQTSIEPDIDPPPTPPSTIAKVIEPEKPQPPVEIERKGQTEHYRKQNEPPPLSPEEAARLRKMSSRPTLELAGQSSPETPFGDFSTSFDAPKYADGIASVKSKASLDFMLMHGKTIPCAIYTQIISDLEGYVTCRVTQDIYSANGAALLIEKGSVVSGSQNVAMSQGQARIFTAWSDIETPLGVNIQIDSLGTGELGAAGIEAWVDNHYAERFGGAIMLSFVDDALATLSNRLSDTTEVTFDNSTENAGEMAAKALESSINIPPTGYAFVGQRINILVVRNIDMSNVYQFE